LRRNEKRPELDAQSRVLTVLAVIVPIIAVQFAPSLLSH
jgi:hypothetical protein